ncbi:MAG TPA: hypothetical protein DCL15_21050 [Chloroflexi bacterium]|nr:hypothetical protein [Chloroflexota bacterium]HHW89121.1 DUF4012 domain-containing protein [Chloroflexota bacterium]
MQEVGKGLIESQPPAQAPSTLRSASWARRRWLLRVLGVLLLVGLLVVGYFGVTIGWAGWKTYQSAMRLRALIATTALDNPVALQDSLAQLSADYDQFTQVIEPILPLVEQMTFVPTYGQLAGSASELLTAGAQVFALTKASSDLFAPTLAELHTAQPNGATSDLLLQALAQQAETLPELAPQIDALRTTLATVDANAMPASLAPFMRAAPALLTLADVATQLGPQLPTLLGMDGPKTYLILVQNNHELRATGGFIAAIGRLTLEQGKLTELDFVDSYSIYRADGRYPPAPAAMQTYMNIPVLVMRDANWSPDLPTAARVAEALYKSDVGLDIDGIVTIDLHAVRRIFTALGEIQAPGFDTPITGENVEEQVVKLWERPAESDTAVGGETQEELGAWWLQRKEFIPRLAQAALSKVQSGDVDMLALASAVVDALDARAIQVWLDHPEAAAVLGAQGWDGALRPSPGSDFLAVVDTNMGYNKVDAAIERALDYQVSWLAGADQPAQVTLTLTYTHPVEAEDPGCDLTPRYGKSYADLIARCYFDYVRVYVPAGSKLIDVTGVASESIATQRGERKTQFFTGYFIMPPHSTHQVTFTYTLPSTLTPDQYRLVVQRQSGTQPLPLTVTINGDMTATTIADGVWEWSPP